LSSSETPVGQRPLPGNPNCVSFAAPTRQVLYGRSWGKVQELAEGALLTFHRACELPVLVGFGARMALDRKNRRQSQLTMFFLFDGPASAEHMDLLDATVAHNPVAWSDAHIERVPANGVHALYAHDGEANLVVRVEGGEERISSLMQRGASVRVVDARVADLEPTDALLDRPRIQLGPPTYGHEEREIERMRLAFAHTFAQRIVEADGIIRDDEAEFMSSVFSPESLARLGLDHPTAHEQYLAAAFDELPGRLGYHDKLALIGLFFTACYSDGSLDAREMRVLKDASDALGVERGRVVKYLQRFW